MKFYIYENSQWNEVQIEISPNLVVAKDTTNDSFSCILKFSGNDKPYKPMTPFKIDYEDSENRVQILWIISDQVSIFTVSPTYYKHSLTIVQYRYFLNKHLIRNTVFNQPRNKHVELFSSLTNYLSYIEPNNSQFRGAASGDGSILAQWNDTLSIVGGQTKFIKATFQIKIYGTFVWTDSNTVNTQEVTNLDLFTIRNNAAFVLMDKVSGSRVLNDYFYISQFLNGEVELTATQISTINTFLQTHTNVQLYFYYLPDDVANNSFFDVAFAIKNDSQFHNYSNLTAQIYFKGEIYNYTMFDVIKILLNQYRLLNSLDIFSKRDLLFNLPEEGDELYELLTNTYPPDTLSFTQSTFYEALEDIFKFYDAGFKFDENKKLNIEYYNDPKNDITRTSSFSGRQITHSDRNYNDGRVTYYQNAYTPFKFPYLRPRLENFGVPTSNSDFALIFPYPIYEITKFEYVSNYRATLPFTVDIPTDGNKVGFNDEGLAKLDLTPFIVNYDLWTTLEKRTNPVGKYTTLQTVTTIPFERGTNLIKISDYSSNWSGTSIPILRYVLRAAVARFFGFPDAEGQYAITTDPDFTYSYNNWWLQVYNVEYLANVNGRLETKTVQPQYKGEMLNNQNSGTVDLNKLGLNMLGESLKNGEPTLTATFRLTTWDRRPKEGDYIIYKNERWVANIVNFSIFDDFIQCSIEFVKNFNSLALRVNNDNAKRLTTISEELSQISEDNYIDYVYVTDQDKSTTRDSITLGRDVLESMVGQTFGIDASAYDIKKIDYIGLKTYDINFRQLNATVINNQALNITNIPFTKYGAGNCMCFEAQYSHPLNAGNTLQINASVFGSTKNLSLAAPYTDSVGRFEFVNVYFLENSTVDAYKATQYYPYLIDSYLATRGLIGSLHYYKKSNEIFALNYEWCFLTLPSQINDFFIGNKFININSFMSPEKMRNKKFYLYYARDDYKYNILDKKGHLGDGLTKANVSFATIRGDTFFALKILTSSYIAANNWAICDEEGDIYFASNNGADFTNEGEYEVPTQRIYFFTKNKRISDDDVVDSTMIPYETVTEVQLKVRPNEWSEMPSEWSLHFEGDPTQFIREDDFSTTGVLRTTMRINAGSTTNPKSINQISIVPESDGSYTNSVTYSYVTEGQIRWAEISVVIYKTNWHTGDKIVADVYYSWQGQEKHYICNYSLSVPGLTRAHLSNITIYPSSETIGTQTFNNSVSFVSSGGYFYGAVYRETKPTNDVIYEISYDID